MTFRHVVQVVLTPILFKGFLSFVSRPIGQPFVVDLCFVQSCSKVWIVRMEYLKTSCCCSRLVTVNKCTLQDFPIKTDWVLSLWQQRKCNATDAVRDMLKSRARGALGAIEVVMTTTQKEHMESQRHEIDRVQILLTNALGAFRPHPRIDTFQDQYDPANYGVLHRYKSLGLFGGTQIGKSSKAISIFGLKATLKVSCQGLAPGTIPSISRLDRRIHSAILWDEIRPDQVLGAKEVFQSAPWVVSLSQSNCNQFAYEVWLYGIAHILCSNSFPMTVSEGVSKEDADWLCSNIIDVTLPEGQRWYFDKATSSLSV